MFVEVLLSVKEELFITADETARYLRSTTQISIGDRSVEIDKCGFQAGVPGEFQI